MPLELDNVTESLKETNKTWTHGGVVPFQIVEGSLIK
jgi:hypothetical protein